RVLGRAQPGVIGQQPLHRGAEAGFTQAGDVQQGPLLLGRQVGSLVEQDLDPVAPLLSHLPSPRYGAGGPSPSRPASQARAKRHSRTTLLTDRPTTSAVSSTLSPA